MKQNSQGQKTKFFEKQTNFSMQCGMHCINNLFKHQLYSKQQMQGLCYQLSSDLINPHKHIFGGDYDINVVMLGLQKKEYQCKWIDKRYQFKLQKYLGPKDRERTIGFILNLQMQKKIYHKIFGMSARHWITIRKGDQQKQFQVCDSNTENVEILKQQNLESFVNDRIKNNGAEVFWIYKE